MSSDECYDEKDQRSGPSEKRCKLDGNVIQSLENYSSFHSISTSKNEDNLVVDEGSLNDDDTNEIVNYFNANSPSWNDVSATLSSAESYSNNSNKSSKSYDSGSDYIPISDGEFELEKPVNDENTNNKCYSDTKDNETDFDKNDSNYYNEKSSMTYDSVIIDNDEVDELLDKAFDDEHDNSNEKKKKGVTPDDFKEYEKIVLEEICKNHFDILPENWIEATHKSGMPVYLHKKLRVVTLSRPYFLGPGSPEFHFAPLSAISCLQYRKAAASQKDYKFLPNFQTTKLGDMVIPNAKVETALENINKESLTPDELRQYCQSLFKFKKVDVNIEENLQSDTYLTLNQNQQRPSLPNSTKLISFPVQTEDHDKRCNRRREWIMNPNGKSYVSILHEYLQQALKTQPWYDFKELENPETPYSATVVLNDVQYGVGIGNSKKQAKLNAAQATLDILIPEMKSKIDSEHQNLSDPVIFDQIKVTDPRVTEFCAKTTEPSPYAMLLVCLQRNFGECDIAIDYKLNNRRRMLNQCTMTVGKHTASVACKNKRDGKQKASQIILGLLHPHIDNWGSLLRLYGNRSIKNAKEKKQEEQEITQLQSKAAVNQPNYAILQKLEEEMLKVSHQRKIKETNNKTSLPQSLLSTTCPYTIEMPSTSSSQVKLEK